MSRAQNISPIEKSSNLDPMLSSKNKQKREYFIAVTEKETDMKVSAIVAQYIITSNMS